MDIVRIFPLDEPIDVGESATNLRIFQSVAWAQGLDKDFIKRGTLIRRPIASKEEVMRAQTQQELLHLSDHSSQWATARALLGDPERLPNPPFKLRLTYDAIDRWQAAYDQGALWVPEKDQTLRRQAMTFVDILAGQRSDFVPEQAEDFCFAVAFGYMTIEEGLRLWPALPHHESNRPAEMATAMEQLYRGEPITSRDHRVVQAMAYLAVARGLPAEFRCPEAVAKSWPGFWDCLHEILVLTGNAGLFPEAVQTMLQGRSS
jgi:hypothetical protein